MSRFFQKINTKKFLGQPKGALLIQVLVFAGISVVLLSGLVGWSGANIKASRQSFYREQALQIAEAGIDYYRWHLAHAPIDFKDGTGAPGPYVHAFNDKDGTRIGQFELEIIPPPTGSTLVTVRSKGKVDALPGIYRRIEAILAKESFAKYAWLLNAANPPMYFGPTSEVFGPIHSNFGIRFDGTAHQIVTSGVGSYTDPEHDGGVEFGVHTHRNTPPPVPNLSVASAHRPLEAPPTSPVPSQSEVFIAGRSFPAPAVDFTGLTQNLQQLKTDAQANGFYRAGSGAGGYHVVLKTNDTFDLYRVDTTYVAANGCINSAKVGSPPELPPKWGTWSIQTKTLLGNFAFPTNGIAFFEDHVWVNGQVSSGRITIASGTFPADSTTYTNIIVNNDLFYTTTDGQDAIALIAQGNVIVGLNSEDDLRIDAAVVAQNGFFARFDYPNNSCNINPFDGRFRAQITTYGTVAASQSGEFCHGSIGGNCEGSGYSNRTYTYDSNLLYSPPPSFPLTADQYETLSWKEIK